MTDEEQTILAVLNERSKTIVKGIDKINTNLEKNYVRKEEFKPVKTIVYGMVSIIMVAVLVAIISNVVGCTLTF